MNTHTTLDNPHLPLAYIPPTLRPDQVADLCNYTVLRALAHEFTQIINGRYTWSELCWARDNITAAAAALARDRWPDTDPDDPTARHRADTPPPPGPHRSRSAWDALLAEPRDLDDTQLLPAVIDA